MWVIQVKVTKICPKFTLANNILTILIDNIILIKFDLTSGIYLLKYYLL
jgi:hypothetical protein